MLHDALPTNRGTGDPHCCPDDRAGAEGGGVWPWRDL